MRAVLEGGPGLWAGRVCDVLGGERIERGCIDTAGPEIAIGVWLRTDRTRDVDVTRRRRHDVVAERKPAVVYEFHGYRRVPREPRRTPEPSQMSFV